MNVQLYTITPRLLSGDEALSRLPLPSLVLPFWDCRKSVPSQRIVRVEGEGNYSVFHFNDGTQLTVSLTLKRLESRLPANVFVRLHKKHIVNLLYLKGINAHRRQLTVDLTTGEQLDVSRRKSALFLTCVQSLQEELDTMTKGTHPTMLALA